MVSTKPKKSWVNAIVFTSLSLDYQGERKTEAMIKFVKQNTPSLVFRISNSEKDSKTTNPQDRIVSLQSFLEKVLLVLYFQGKRIAKDNSREKQKH